MTTTLFDEIEALREVAQVVRDTGGRRFAVVWTHPEYPIHTDDAPPPGTPVVWSLIATYTDRIHCVSARSADWHRALTTACVVLMCALDVNVTVIGSELAELVPTPIEAIREALA